MRARLDMLGADYEIVDAVDGATLTAADYGDNILHRDQFRRKRGREIIDGEFPANSPYEILKRRYGEAGE